MPIVVLLYWVPRQPAAPYPYDIRKPRTLAEAVHAALVYPADSRVHLELAAILRQRQFPADRIVSESRAALELEPTNPAARDLLADLLARSGRPREALTELERSVFNAPSIGAHSYLNERLLPWLTPAERRAVTNGLRAAAGAGSSQAVNTLSWLYQTFGLYQEEASFLMEAAARERRMGRRAELLSSAGLAMAQAGSVQRAGQLLEQAIAIDPSNPEAYRNLARSVYVPIKRFDQARAVLKRGIANSAGSTRLYLTLAEVEQDAGKQMQAEQALQSAVSLQPYNFELVRQLGLLYREHGKFDQAIKLLGRVTELNPRSGQAFFELAQAEDDSYQYFAAEQDYARAVKLSPDNPDYAAAFRDFKSKVSQNLAH